jgi:hypothetical protein
MIAIYAALTMVKRLLVAFTPTGHVAAAGSDAEHLVKDPVCGTYVPQANAIEAGGQFFCSEECRRKFRG